MGLGLRIRFRMAEVHTITSEHATRPVPSALRISCWVTTPSRVAASMTRICSCWLVGNTSMIRSMVCGAVLGVQRAEDEVARLRRRQGHRDGLEVTHLTDQDHVGVLAKNPPQGLGERLGVLADLPLVDDRPLVVVEELDRVLDRHDVQRLGPVDDVDQRGQGGRLTRPGRTGDEHQAPPELGERLDRVGDTQVSKSGIS